VSGEYDESRIHTATQEDLDRLYPDGFLIGPPVSQDDPDDNVDKERD
jgi:hypothetical protein